jgi:hypothetical protein
MKDSGIVHFEYDVQKDYIVKSIEHVDYCL